MRALWVFDFGRLCDSILTPRVGCLGWFGFWFSFWLCILKALFGCVVCDSILIIELRMSVEDIRGAPFYGAIGWLIEEGALMNIQTWIHATW